MAFFQARDLPFGHLSFLGGQQTASVIGEDDSLDLIDKPPPSGADVPLHSQMAAVTARRTIFVEERGTAFRIGPRSWLTSAHVLRHYRSGFSANSAEIAIGFGASQRLPVTWELHPGWVEMGEIGFDLAILVAETAPIGPSRPFRLASEPAAALRKAKVNVVGYRSTLDIRWRITEIDNAVFTDRLFHTGDTVPGESGGPLIVWPPLTQGTGDLTVVGIHSRGAEDPVSRDGRNTATRITDDLLRWVQDRIV